MILNLVGPPGGGKTTFRMFLERYGSSPPIWSSVDIADFRVDPKLDENDIWDKMTRKVKKLSKNGKHVILETSGTLWRLAELWQEVNENLYTVLVTASIPICKTRLSKRLENARKTNKAKYIIQQHKLAYRYIDEEKKLSDRITPNLCIDTTNLDAKMLTVFLTAERHIKQAVEFFDRYNGARVIGYNNLLETKK